MSHSAPLPRRPAPAVQTITPEQLGTWTLAAKSAMYFISM